MTSVEQLREQAREYTASHPEDLDGQVERWGLLLREAPQDEEALRRLYIIAFRALEKGKETLKDAAGLVGDAGGETPVGDFLEKVRQRYREVVPQVVRERLEQAENAWEQEPERARALLQDARALTEDPELPKNEQAWFHQKHKDLVERIDTLWRRLPHADAEVQEQDAEASLANQEVPAEESATRKNADEIEALRRHAREYARSVPGDIESQRRYWEGVLRLAPEDQEAQAQLKSLVAEAARREAQQQAEKWARTAKEAFEKKDIKTLREAREALRELVKKHPGDEGLKSLLSRVEEDYENLSDELGMVFTLVAQNKYREAFKKAKHLLDAGVEGAIDIQGILGGAGGWVSMREVVNNTLERYLETLPPLVQRHLQDVKALLNTDPLEAKKKLEEVRGWLEDEDFPADVRERLRKEHGELWEEMQALQAALENQGEDHVAPSSEEANAPKASKGKSLLAEAKQFLDEAEQALEDGDFRLTRSQLEQAESLLERTDDFVGEEQNQQREALLSRLKALQSRAETLQREYEMWEPQLQEGQKALERQDWLRAKSIFEKIKKEAPARWAALAEQVLQDVGAGLRRAVEEARQDAREYAKSAPDDIEGQRRRWEEVLRLSPEDREAQAQLKSLAAEAARREAQQQAEKWARTAEEAFEKKDIKTLREAREALRELVRKHPGDEGMKSLLSRVGEDYEKLSDELGLTSTLVAQEKYREAFKRAKHLLGEGVEELIDVGGVWGEAGGLVPTVQAFHDILEKYLASLPALAQRHLQDVEALLNTDPLEAKKKLEEVRGWLEDEDFPADVRERLRKEHGELWQKMETLKRALGDALEKYNRAVDLVEQARGTNEIEKQVNLLREAKRVFPAYDISPFWSIVRPRWESVLLRRLDDALVEAEALRRQGRFDEALARLEKAQKEVYNNWVEGESWTDQLKNKLSEVHELLRKIRGEKIDWEGVEKEIKSALEQLPPPGSGARPSATVLEMVDSVLEEVPEKFKRFPQVRQLTNRRDAYRTIDELWGKARQAYRQGRWEDAEEKLERILAEGGAWAREARSLLKRVQAVGYYESGVKAQEGHRWSEAVRFYEQAVKNFEEVGTDVETEGIFQQARAALDLTKQIDENNPEIKRLLDDKQAFLTRIRRLLPDEQFEELLGRIRELQEWQGKPSSYEREIREQLQEMRSKVRDLIKEAAKLAIADKNLERIEQALEMYRRWEALGEGSAEEDELRRQLEIARLDAQFEDLRLRMSTPEEYQKALENREARLRLTVEEETRKQIEKQVHDLRQQTFLAHWRELLEGKSTHEGQDAVTWAVQQWRRPEIRAEILTILEKMVALALSYDRLDIMEALAQAVEREIGLGDLPIAKVLYGVSRMAQYLSEGAFRRAEAEKEHLQEILEGQNREILEEVDRLWDRIASRYVDQWTRDIHQKDLSIWEKGRLLARLHSLAPNDTRVPTALADYWDNIVQEMERQLQEGERISIRLEDEAGARKSLQRLRQMIDEAEDLLDALQGLEHRQSSLEDWREQWGKLEEKYERMRALFDTYQRARQALDNAKRSPVRHVGGGVSWEFDAVEEALGEARKAIAGWNFSQISNLRNAVEDVEDEVQRLEGLAKNVGDKAQEFLEKVRTEQWQEAKQALKSLEAEWNTARRQGLDGLEEALRYNYEFLGVTVRSLQKHEEILERILNNISAWEQWKRALLARKKDFDEIIESVGDEESLRDGLREVLRLHPLARVLDICEEAKAKIRTFERAFDERPDEVLSAQAQKIAQEGSKLQEEVNRKSKLFRVLCREAQQRKEDLEQKLETLRHWHRQLKRSIREVKAAQKSIWGKVRKPQVSQITLRSAERALREVVKLDPKNEEAKKVEETIKRAKEGQSSSSDDLD